MCPKPFFFFLIFSHQDEFFSFICLFQASLFLPLLTLKADKLKTYKWVSQGSASCTLDWTPIWQWSMWNRGIYQALTQTLASSGVQAFHCPPLPVCQSMEKKKTEVEKRAGKISKASERPRLTCTATEDQHHGSWCKPQWLCEPALWHLWGSACPSDHPVEQQKNHTPQRSYTDSFLWDANLYQLVASQNNRNVWRKNKIHYLLVVACLCAMGVETNASTCWI